MQQNKNIFSIFVVVVVRLLNQEFQLKFQLKYQYIRKKEERMSFMHVQTDI